MGKSPVYHAFKMPSFYLHILEALSVTKKDDEKERKEFPAQGYTYQDFGFNDLAVKAKIDIDCQNELFQRMSGYLYRYANSCAQNMYGADVSNVLVTFYDTVRRAVEIYEPTKGPFIHLVRKMLKNAILSYGRKEARLYHKQMRYFERLKQNPAYQYFLEDASNINGEDEEKIRQSLDLEEYKNWLNEGERRILELYLKDYTCDEIAEAMELSKSTVSNILNRIIEELKIWAKKKLI